MLTAPVLSLPPMPVLDIPAGAEPAVASALAEPERLEALLAAARHTYTPLGMRFADYRSRVWAGRSVSPYAAAVLDVHRAMGRPGAYLLNYSYEWGCTTGAVEDAVRGGPTLLRTLDWPLDNLGRAAMVVRQHGAAGPYFSVTWPGFAGVLTGLAPGRFAAAINQPPLPLPGWGRPVSWLAARLRVNRQVAMSPTHLLRLAFDRCRDFAEAVAMIRATPICLPAIFTLSGMAPGETVVIERTQRQAFIPAVPCAANHWAAEPGPKGRPRNPTSLERRAAMVDMLTQHHGWSMDWLRAPILVGDTRLAVMANARSGRMLVQGWEKTGAVTAVLDLAENT